MAINYRFQDHPGQYSGSLSSNHGMLVFRATRNDEQAENIVIRAVKVRDKRITVKLRQIIILPFRAGEEVSAVASLRFRISSGVKARIDLRDRKVDVSGVINYTDGVKKPYHTVLSIGEIYHSSSAIL
ncbi:MAG: hypothetical protein ACN6O7_05015 [Sphingobacterium sp.]